MTREEFPRAIAICPHANHCQHNTTSRIGPSGICPDCGTHVFRRVARPSAFGTMTRGSGSFLAAERSYNGGWLD